VKSRAPCSLTGLARGTDDLSVYYNMDGGDNDKKFKTRA